MTAMEELELRRKFEEALRAALAHPERREIVEMALRMIVEGKGEAMLLAEDERQRDRAEERRVAISRFFFHLGIHARIPRPDASNDDFGRWDAESRALFYRPGTRDLGYGEFMRAIRQEGNWTVENRSPLGTIQWEDVEAGYWFLIEVARSCPRLGTSWKELSGLNPGLACLEEYAFAHQAHLALTGERMDAGTSCWLRTRLGKGTLSVSATSSSSRVTWHSAGCLVQPYRFVGGRTVEIVPNAP